jgi:4-alpha-glucanotransferase
LIDRDQVWTVKRAALSSLFAESADLSDLAAFEAWAAGQGDALTGFATWAALADAHGPDWRLWPLELRQHDSVAVASWRSAHADEVAFHAWLQWQIEQQLSVAASAGSAVGSALVTDLAIGADPGGADTWVWPSVFAEGVTVGAPPDGFSPDGQDWGLPPFDPWRLRAAGYDPFIQIVRAALSTGGGVRIDHVIGLFRSFWVPDGLSPAEGVYVRYPWEDLINIVALEAHRAGAFVIGEDLGTVEPWVRSELASRNILSYRLLCFEDDPPTSWPELALAAVSTHDLPTIEGVLTGADDDARRIVGLTVDDQASAQMRARLCDAGESTERIYEALAASPALLAVASLEDALGVTKRPNHPGSVNEWPNWRIPLPLALEEIETDPRVANLSRVLAGYDRSAISGGI